MFFKESPSRGHIYYTVVQTKRDEDVIQHKKIVYVGRIDTLTPERKNALTQKIKELGDRKLLLQYYKLLSIYGYDSDLMPVTELSVPNLEDYGDIAAQHQVFQELGIVEIINKYTYKGGGTLDVGRLTEIMAINRNSDPCSRRKIPTWYANTALPILLDIKPDELYGRILLRALTYLQEKSTISIQREIYDKIKRVFGYEPTKVYYDITSTYFEGTCCSLAKHGFSSDKRRDKLQIVLGLVVDQEGILITHSVHEGNTVSVETVEEMSKILKKEFEITNSVIVMDRGMTSENNIKLLDDDKHKYLMAHKLNSTEKKLLQKALKTRVWKEIEEGTKATTVTVTKNNRIKKYVFVHKQRMENDDWIYRESQLVKAEVALEKVLASIKSKKIKEQDIVKERVGHILRAKKVTKLFDIKYKKRGLGFKYSRNKKTLQEKAKYDGYYVLCTTDQDMDVKEAIQVYRERDLVEKAIRTLKSVLDLRPAYVYDDKCVRGYCFVCALAYQVRSVMNYKLRKSKVDMNVDEAFEHLARLKIVNIVFDDDKTKVFRKFSSADGKDQKLVIEVFNLDQEMKKITL